MHFAAQLHSTRDERWRKMCCLRIVLVSTREVVLLAQCAHWPVSGHVALTAIVCGVESLAAIFCVCL